jgi:uncharacterized coiled-coil DUF342 family protein
MNREEKRQLVCQLYKEGKTMREIAKDVHMSFSEIGSITKKLNQDLEPKRKEISRESQALKLFNKEEDPVDVAISLDLPASKAEGIYKQFLKLRGLSGMVNLYEEIKFDIPLLAKVYDTVKAYSLSKDDIINIVRYAPEHLYLKDDIKELKEEVNSLLNQKSNVKASLLSIKVKLKELSDQRDYYNDVTVRKYSYIENLNSKIKELETYISKLKNSDEYYTKFEQFAREKLDSIMKDRRWVLSLAVGSVIESLRSDPEKQMMIVDSTISEESFQSVLLGMSEKLFEKILEQLTDVTMKSELKAVIGENNNAKLIM